MVFALSVQHCERILNVMSYRCTGLVFRFECYDDRVRLLGRQEQSSHHDEIGHSRARFYQHVIATDRGGTLCGRMEFLQKTTRDECFA